MINSRIKISNHNWAKILFSITLLFSVFTYSGSPSIYASNKTSLPATELEVKFHVTRRRIIYFKTKTVIARSPGIQDGFMRWVFAFTTILKLFEKAIEHRLTLYQSLFDDFRQPVVLFSIQHRSFYNCEDSFHPVRG